MVLDRDSQDGQAVLAPCLHPAESFEDVRAEAEALWAAETKGRGTGVGASWGCVGALFAPEVADHIQKDWSTYFREGTRPIGPVDDMGNLGIDWPRRCSDGALVNLDVILATATKPEEVSPSNEDIATAWADQTSGEERYFLENIRGGIRTSADESIWEHILRLNPTWLDGPLREEIDRYLFPPG